MRKLFGQPKSQIEDSTAQPPESASEPSPQVQPDMDVVDEKREHIYNILVLGIEKKGLEPPTKPIRARNYCLHFETYSTHLRLNEFDGVILFKGIFESFKRHSPGYSSAYITCSCDEDELDKRKKEARILLNKGGFLCFLLDELFLDQDGERDFKGTDLAKFHLSYDSLRRRNFGSRFTHLNCVLSEFGRFLDVHGAASSYFENYNQGLEWGVIARANGSDVGMIINRAEYFIPVLVPDNRPKSIEEFFSLLADALVSTQKKLHQELPSWLDEFAFEEEGSLQEERSAHHAAISALTEKIGGLKEYKSILVLTGDELVSNVSRVFQKGFGIQVDSVDELREDIKLLDEQKQPFCLCEIKGINRGVTREHINQTDSHRERSGFDSEFPALLIANTNIKSARSILEKDQDIADEQVRHATKMNVLVLRTLDLLELLRLYLNDQITIASLIELLTRNSGWLKVDKDGHQIITGND